MTKALREYLIVEFGKMQDETAKGMDGFDKESAIYKYLQGKRDAFIEAQAFIASCAPR